jgi:small-conductance mechanosensitive channel
MEKLTVYIDKIKGIFESGSSYPVLFLKAGIAIAGALIVWLIIRRLLTVIEKRTEKSETFQMTEHYFRFIRRVLFYALILLIGAYLIKIFEIQILKNAFYAVFIIMLAAPVRDLLNIIINYLEKRLAARSESKVDDIIFEILKKFLGAIVYATAIILALDVLGINVMPLVAGAGVAGVAIGFAAKDTLSNLIAGILLLIDRPFEIGDRIEVWSAPSGSATWGDVIDIGLRATKIKTTDNIIIIIPNNEVMMRDIVNYTILNKEIRVRINFGIAYDADIQKAKNIINGVAAEADWILKNPPPAVVVRNFGESSVDLQARVWINDARKRMKTISHMTDRTKTEFDQAGIEIPFPRRDITIIGDKPTA